jgi:hypothetical protein
MPGPLSAIIVSTAPGLFWVLIFIHRSPSRDSNA